MSTDRVSQSKGLARYRRERARRAEARAAALAKAAVNVAAAPEPTGSAPAKIRRANRDALKSARAARAKAAEKLREELRAEAAKRRDGVKRRIANAALARESAAAAHQQATARFRARLQNKVGRILTSDYR